MNEITIREDFRTLIPPLAPDEYRQLEANLLKDGCRDPLVVWMNVLIDGHNRYELCQKHGIEFNTAEIEFHGDVDAKLWIINNQQGRRNLPDIDKIALARSKEELLKPKAKENQKLSKGRGKKGLAKLPNLSHDIHTRREAAKEAGVGERTYDAGKLILESVAKGETSPQVLDDLRQRKTAIHRVAKDIKTKRAKATRDAKRAAASAGVEIIESIHIGDFRDIGAKVPDGSLSLIFTDPPYDRSAESTFAGLADFAARTLSDGGSIVFYLGHLQLPSAFASFNGKLRHWWTCACIHAGDKALMREYGVRAGWKPMLWFVKQTRHDTSNIISDTVTGRHEKEHHDWQQAECEAAHWIEALCPLDGIVCDPFLGGGTTAVAAKRLGRRWCGFELNEQTAATASQRIHDTQV